MQITVVIPVYNAEAFIKQAVDSVLCQPEVAQVALVEDGSQDGSLDVCQRLACRHAVVELYRHAGGENRGAGETRSLGVCRARCDYIAFLDADDYYLPGRFVPAREVLEHHPEADGVYDAVGTDFATPDVRSWWAEIGRSELSTIRRRIEPERLFEVLITGEAGSFHTNGIVARRKLFERTGPFDAHLRMTQDFAMWIKMAAVGRLLPGQLHEPVAMRRLHGENRIIKQREEHARYGHLMWQTLAAWAQQAGLPADRRWRLLKAVMESWLNLPPQSRTAVSGHASTVRFLGELALQHPKIITTARYWRQMGRAFGGSRLRTFFGRLAYSSSGRRP